MTSKERVLTTLACKAADRVPVDYAGNPGIDGRLKQHFGVSADDNEGLLKALNVDFRRVGAPYRGPKLHEGVPARGVKVDNWGIHRRWIEHARRGYCRDTLEIMMPGGGYCFSPTHQLQDNSPTENVLAMYDAARKYGKY